MNRKICLSQKEFQNLEECVSTGFPTKLIVVCRDNCLQKFLEEEYDKISRERHWSRGVMLELCHDDKTIIKYTSMARFFSSSFNDAMSGRKFANFGESSPKWSEVYPWVGKNPTQEEIENYYAEKFSISLNESVHWIVIYISD